MIEAAGNGSIDGAGAPSTPAPQQWSKLSYDLLSAIYLRFDSPRDRVRFAAVCTQWRAAASHPWRRVLPWLILNPCVGGDKMRQQLYCYCPHERTVQSRLPFMHDAAGRDFLGGHEGGWIASSETPIRIVNVFSRAEVMLPGQHIVNGLKHTGDPLVLRQVIFSEQPTSSGCILAGITDKHQLAFYAVGFPESGWATRGFYGDDGLADIAFCNGELYGITRFSKRLIKYELGADEHGTPLIRNIHWLCALGNYWEVPHDHARYIVELGGKLLMVGSNNKWWSRCLRNSCGSRFTVHELVDTDTEMNIRNVMKYKWVEVDSLGEYALFLGPTCSKAVRVPASGCGDVQRNHIYFSHHRCLRQKHEIPNGAEVILTTSNEDDLVYYKEVESDNGSVEGIMSVGYYVMGGIRPPMWIFPLDI